MSGLSGLPESSNIRAGQPDSWSRGSEMVLWFSTGKFLPHRIDWHWSMFALLTLFALSFLFSSVAPADANPYLARPGERPISIRIATCAVSGGFAHLYTALENNLFDKYGFKMEHVFIRGSGPALAAL